MKNTITASQEMKNRVNMINAYAEIVEWIERNERYYQTESDDGVLCDNDDEYSAATLAAYRTAISAIKKLAGI